MDPIAAILKRIANGQQQFAPANDSLEAVRAFQKEVQVLREAARLELIVELHIAPPSKGRDTYGLSQLAFVSGGLSYQGEKYLAVPPRKASETRTWVMSHLAQIAVGVIGAVLSAIIIAGWGLQ